MTDPALNAYVKGIICKLEPEYCDDIRLYIVKTAGMNAAMAPHGAMYLWTGAFLRLENEAQLAYLLGHELAHYRLRHYLQKWRDLRATQDGFAFFAIATAGVGLVPLTVAGGLAASDSILSFSREKEREADIEGFQRMVTAGYDPREALTFWALYVEEEKASDQERPSVFWSTHPQPEDRKDLMSKSVDELGELPKDLTVGRERYMAETTRFRRAWLAQEVKYADFGRALAVFDQLLQKNPEAGDIYFAKGEMLRRRDEEDDQEKAIEAYRRAISLSDHPVDTYRSLGLAQWNLKRNEQAIESFKTYLSQHPDADDHLIIKSYIEQLK